MCEIISLFLSSHRLPIHVVQSYNFSKKLPGISVDSQQSDTPEDQCRVTVSWNITHLNGNITENCHLQESLIQMSSLGACTFFMGQTIILLSKIQLTTKYKKNSISTFILHVHFLWARRLFCWARYNLQRSIKKIQSVHLWGSELS